MILTLANTFVPILAGLLLGYLAGLWKFVDNQNVRTLITFVMSVALPCSLFSTIGQLSRPTVQQQGEVAAVLGVTYSAVFLVVYFWAARWERLPPAGSAVLALTLSFPNLAAVGYPLLEAMHGPSGDVAAATGVAIGSITVSPVTLAVLENSTDNAKNLAAGRSVVRSIVKALKKPVVWAPVLGIVFALSSIRLAKYLELSLATMGSATTGTALFLTGLVVSAQAFRLNHAVILSVLGKNIVQPAFSLLLATAIGMEPHQRDYVVLLSAVPCGFFGIVFGKNFPNTVPQVANASLIASYIAGLFTMSGWMVLLGHLHPNAA
jgi:malonate transporter and related proteins